ncbi:hypothetical protein F5X68DRAFT_210210, partial [Plectosphaerella plurivora]
IGARRPRVLYLVAVGSNPTGITISAARRREIYALSVQYGMIPALAEASHPFP